MIAEKSCQHYQLGHHHQFPMEQAVRPQDIFIAVEHQVFAYQIKLFLSTKKVNSSSMTVNEKLPLEGRKHCGVGGASHTP